MPTDLRAVKNFPQLLRYLRDELLWPIETDDAEELSFEYTAADFSALASEHHVQIEKILQLRPLVTAQPWGIFYVQFKKARLPVIVLRELLASLVFKKRASANKSERPAWECHDLLFISSYGEDADHRHLNFAHFSDTPNGHHLPALRVLDWDEDDTNRSLQRLDVTLHEKLRWPADDANLDAWRTQWSDAFSRGLRYPIKKAEQLAQALAILAKNIRGRVLAQMAVESERGRLRTLHAAFKAALIHDLEDKQFADMFAQTIAYGLFANATRRTVAGAGTVITADGAVDSVTSMSPFLRSLLDEFLSVGGRRRSGLDFDKLGVNEVVDLLNAESTDLRAVLDDFGHKTRDEDPVIHFYEGFAKLYDPIDKVKRGEFYTPTPVVSYIVRSVHELLQEKFGLSHGLAATETWGEMRKNIPSLALPNLSDDPDPTKARLLPESEFFVQVLDPATGTATFLIETIDVVHRHLKAAWEARGGGLAAMPEIHAKPAGSKPPKTFLEYWQLYVPTSLLPRLYAFELKMAPYAIAHMKIALKLADTGFTAWSQLEENDRARIYLTNALEPKFQQLPQVGFEALAQEADAVNRVKWDKRFTVIIGNPPYAGNSANASRDSEGRLTFIGQLIEDYKQVDGQPLGERQPKWLQDDYVKFIRLAEFLTTGSGCGIVGFITSHSYLDNPTFRGMRQHLLTSFNQLWTLDLHGNTTKKEVPPLGIDDKNVFDIKQGVAVMIGLRCEMVPRLGSIDFAEIWEKRDAKYARLETETLRQTSWARLAPSSRFYLFVPQNIDLREEYEHAWSITRVMPTFNVGFVSARDEFVIDFEPKPIRERIELFIKPDRVISTSEIRSRFGLKDTTSWNLEEARESLRRETHWDKSLTKCLYRAFDVRHIIYSRDLLERPVYQIQRHLLDGKNLGLLVSRQVVGDFQHVFATNIIANFNALATAGRLGSGPVFPLYLLESDDPNELKGLRGEKVPNLGQEFLRHISVVLGLGRTSDTVMPTGLTPEDIFHYTYAVFHSPCYRSRYAAFLKGDFPRLPLPGCLELFRELSHLGRELVSLHLLQSPALDRHITEFIGGRSPEVEKISWSENTVWVDKAQTFGCKGVTKEVWDFHIGGYEVCKQWLKDRKGRNLSADDRNHYQKVIVALSETIRLMAEIDMVIEDHGGFPSAFATIPSVPTTYTQPASPAAPPLDLEIQTDDELSLG